MKPQIRRLLSEDLATAAEKQAGEESVAAASSSSASGSEPPQKVPRSSLAAMYAELLAEGPEHEPATADPASSQINLYLSENVLDVETEKQTPLEFWKKNEGRFPALAQAARSYLCAPPTSVDSERLFSVAGLIIDEKRNRLTAKNAEMLIFAKTNLPLLLPVPADEMN